MEVFFNMMAEFLKSDFGQNYGWIILTWFIIFMILGWFIMWMIFVKIIVPHKLIESNNKERDYDALCEENKQLKAQIFSLNSKLEKFQLESKMYDAIEGGDTYIDLALLGFVKQ